MTRTLFSLYVPKHYTPCTKRHTIHLSSPLLSHSLSPPPYIGWAQATSDWTSSFNLTLSGGRPPFPYAIATLDLSGYIRDRLREQAAADDTGEDTLTGDNSTNTNTNNTNTNNKRRILSRTLREEQRKQARIKRKLRIKYDTTTTYNTHNNNMHHTHGIHRRKMNSNYNSMYTNNTIQYTNNNRRYIHRLLSSPTYNSINTSSSTIQQNTVENREKSSNSPLLPQNDKKSPTTTTSSPTFQPTYVEIWERNWIWLPGFLGGNGPILQMSKGHNSYRDYLFIVGAFNNYPSVILWSESANITNKISVLSSKQHLQGLVTSIAQMRVKHYDTGGGNKPSNPNDPPSSNNPPGNLYPGADDYTFLILISCVLVGVLLGVLFAFGCRFGGSGNGGGYTKLTGVDPEADTGIPLAGVYCVYRVYDG